MTTNLDVIRDEMIELVQKFKNQELITEREAETWISDLKNDEGLPSIEEMRLTTVFRQSLRTI